MSGNGKGAKKVTSLDPEEAALIEDQVGEIMDSIPGPVWDGHSLPIPVEEIAREIYGLRVCHKNQDEMREVIGDRFTEGTLSGLLLSSAGEIWINEEEAAHPEWGVQRKRFTVGHELGHYVMHQNGQTTIFCRNEEGEGQGTEPTPRPVPEVEANTFSAALMMPASFVREEMRRCSSDEESVAALMGLFQASDKAARRRVETLRAID